LKRGDEGGFEISPAPLYKRGECSLYPTGERMKVRGRTPRPFRTPLSQKLCALNISTGC